MVKLKRYLLILVCLCSQKAFSEEFSDRAGFEETKVFPKNFYLKADVLRVRKSKPENQVLAYSSISKETSFSASDMNFSARYGFQVTASKILTPIRNIEISYMRVRFNRTWQTLDRTQTDFSAWIEQPISNASYQYISKLQDTELRFMNQLSPNYLIFTGIRYVYLPEDFRLNQRFPLGPSNLTYNIQTQNSLAGPEIGFTFFLPASSPVLLKLFLKTGIFVNSAKQISKATLSGDPSGGTSPGFPLSRVSKTNFSFATVSESKLDLIGKVSQWCHVYLGYDVLLITGLALASEQFVQRLLFPFPAGIGNTGLNENDQEINLRGRNFYHYLDLGVEFRW